MTAAPTPTSQTSATSSDEANKASASNIKVLHQRSHLKFSYENSKWDYSGRTTIWLIKNGSAQQQQITTTATAALHFRGEVSSVKISSINQSSEIIPLRSEYLHLDPLQKVLQTHDPHRIDADTRSCRMSSFDTGLRSSACASYLGELRVKFDLTDCCSDVDVQEAASVGDFVQTWKKDIDDTPCTDSNNDQQQLQDLESELRERDSTRRSKRLDLIAQQLGEASLYSFSRDRRFPDMNHPNTKDPRSTPPLTIRIDIDFQLPACAINSCSRGLNFCHPSTELANSSPFVYTTSGEFGDHEGPRMWLPCLDSAASKHRSSHELIICVCAPSNEGFSVVGCGEDIGVSSTALSDMDDGRSSTPLGLFATTRWLSAMWSPLPARCLGFAIGPFTFLNDFEYADDADEDEEPVSTGNGIRQAFLAPLEERHLIHSAQSIQKSSQSRAIDMSVMGGTSGVPLRALNIAKDVIGLPSHQSASYTQVWLPSIIDGGTSSGSLQQCGVATNSWLGGATLDASLLPPPSKRLPFYCGGRTLQLAQARCAITGFVRKGVALGGGQDDAGEGWMFQLFISQLLSIYLKAYGGSGEGGGPDSHFYVARYASVSGSNSPSMEFLGFANVENDTIGVASAQADIRSDLWRSEKNGTESRTSASDEFAIRNMLLSDALEGIERNGPSPSNVWKGSYLSLTFLSSNSCNSTCMGSGVVDMCHPIGGIVYRALKSNALSRLIQARAGLQAFIKTIRASFFSTLLTDAGEKCVSSIENSVKDNNKTNLEESGAPQRHHKPPFILVVEEMMKKGTTHVVFTRSLKHIAGIAREQYLRGTTFVDVGKDIPDAAGLQNTNPEGFPNSFVRGSGGLYLRVGAHIEAAGADSATPHAPTAAVKGVHLHLYAEQMIPENAIAFGGPITIRIVENEGQCREFVRNISEDGSRVEWGPIFLHASPVASNKQQTAASGTIEGSDTKPAGAGFTAKKKAGIGGDVAYNDELLHVEGYQAIELARLTNRTPLLWIRVDPEGLYGGIGKITTFQQDACVADQLFHDGDTTGQLHAMRTLAERPFRIQGAVKVTSVYDARVNEIPVRVLGDCLRGSVALHSSFPHTPGIRAQAALAIAQWQNNKAPASRNVVGSDSWLGLNLLLQYFKERFENNLQRIMPSKFTRKVLRKSNGDYQYLDEVKANAKIQAGDADIDCEEDEEYRVRSAVVTAILCIRAKDGQTPAKALKFIEKIICSGDGAAVEGHISDALSDRNGKRRKRLKLACSLHLADGMAESSNFVADSLMADALLALCHINVRPTQMDPSFHPVLKLMQACRRWLNWSLYKEETLLENEETAISGVGLSSARIAPCAITALVSLALLRQSTSNSTSKTVLVEDETTSPHVNSVDEFDDVIGAKFYSDIFSRRPRLSDVTRAAAAQAVACICCAVDRFKKSEGPVGLLSALEFLLDSIIDSTSTMGLRLSLAAIMYDACTGKVCSVQRIASIAGCNDLGISGARLYDGPLGGCNGGDNGSTLLMSVTELTNPTASSVNDGARKGLGLLKCKINQPPVAVRVAKFATKFWRTINGDTDVPGACGVCSRDGNLRASLLMLWQWIWPDGCPAINQVQSWRREHENTEEYKRLGAHEVMQINEDEKRAAQAEEIATAELKRVVRIELDRQKWRSEMALKAYQKNTKEAVADSTISHGLGVPLPLLARDKTWMLGGWATSAACQRRARGLDGGAAISKVRLKVASSSGET